MNRRTWLLIVLVALAALGMSSVASAGLLTNSASSPATDVSAQAPDKQNDPLATQPEKGDPFGIRNFNCADIAQYGIDRQTNVRAAAIMAKCGGTSQSSSQANSGSGDANSAGTSDSLPAAPALGGTDKDVILPDGTAPHITQSETFVWGHGTTVVVNYNDSRLSGGCYSGIAYSTDSGTTWHASTQLCTGHSTNYGDPTVVYNASFNKWYATDLASGCGGQGLGAWTSPDGITWSAGPCVHNNSADDRNSFWVDNNASSPYYGYMYQSYNNFNIGGGALIVARSTDGGVTWSSGVQVANGNPFIRDVQITGDVQGSGTVYLAGMDEGGGGLSNRINHMYHSTNGGATFTDVVMGAAFYPPGRGVSGYFAGMYAGGYFRHMGWGQPAASGAIVSYVYAMGIQGTDKGNIMYTRSTDSGATWSSPIKLNTDPDGTHAQFMPSLAATTSGALLATWYDERNNGRSTNDCASPGTNSPCYERFARISLDNGATWQADASVSDAISPLPAQNDPNIQPLYAGDYDYSSADGNTAYTTWDDGRTLISGTSQQDVYFDKVDITVGTPTPTPTGTLPTNTPTNTPTFTPSPTLTPCASGAIVNGDFETGSFAPWVILGTQPPPSVSTALPHAGTYSALLGTLSGTEPLGDSSIYQTITVPAGGGTLSYWYNPSTTDSITFDWQDAYITDTSGNILATIMHVCENTNTWTNVTFNMAPYAGQTVRIEFLVHQDGFGDDTSMYVDDVLLLTACNTPVATDTPTETDTPVPTDTDTPVATSTETPTACTIAFEDVPVGSTFYPYIECLACRGIINGYPCGGPGEPCNPTNDPYFRPGNNVTRGQFSKIASNSAGFNDPPDNTQQYQDVAVGSTFYDYVWRLSDRGLVTGYPCGGAGEPCGPGNLPYFRPNANVTRGQLSKIDSNAAGYNDTPGAQQYEDVAPGSTFFDFIWRLSDRGIINGYPCGGPGEPCGPGNLPYFRPSASATRGQASKIVANTFFPNCQVR